MCSIHRRESILSGVPNLFGALLLEFTSLLNLGNKDTTRTSELGIVILQLHFGKLLDDPEGTTEAGKLCKESQRKEPCQRCWKCYSHLQGHQQWALPPASQPAHHPSPTVGWGRGAQPLSVYTCLTSYPSPSDSCFPLWKLALLFILTWLFWYLGACGEERTSEALGKGPAIRCFRPFHPPKCAAAYGPEENKGTGAETLKETPLFDHFISLSGMFSCHSFWNLYIQVLNDPTLPQHIRKLLDFVRCFSPTPLLHWWW